MISELDMASMTEADFGSDTDDDDYVPEGETHEASEEENSGEDENNVDKSKAGVKNKKKRKSKKTLTGRKNVFEEDGEKVDWKKALEEEKKELDEEKKKLKENDIWAAFKKDTSVKPAPSKPKSSIASLFSDSPSESKNMDTKKPTNRLSSLFDDEPKETKHKSGEKPKSLLSGLFDNDDKKTVPNDKDEKSAEPNSDKIEIKKVFDFAGEMVTVSKQVSLDSAEAKKFLKSQEGEGGGQADSSAGTERKRPSGLAGIVSSIGKKQKMGVLDKSKLDWGKFVDEEGISEQLKTHNKGKDG